MVIQPRSRDGYSDNLTIKISQEGLRSILNQIESELVDSEVYRRTMAGLQTMLGEESNTAQLLVKAVGREAVRLTFQQFNKQHMIIPVNTEKREDLQDKKLECHQEVEDSSGDGEIQFEPISRENIGHSIEPTKIFSLVNREIGETQPRKKITNAEISAQRFALEREETLRNIGNKLRQARQDYSLTQEQLYRQTLVPIYQIDALENCRIDQLPEDIYIRGFIRRLGQALGLNGIAMAESLPTEDPIKTTIPSWYKDPFRFGLQFNTVHLYVGYAALIAGAVGGLNWMSHQSSSGVSVEPQSTNTPQTSSVSTDEKPATASKPGVKLTQKGVKVGGDIAPPEALPF